MTTTNTHASAAPSPYGSLSDQGGTLTLQRLLPGSAERVWAYLIDSELRSRWLAAGQMQSVAGTECDMLWRNDTLSASPAERPEGFAAEARAAWRIEEVQPQRLLRITWPGVGEVSFALEPRGDKVLLTVTHRRLASRDMCLMVGAGWHMHLDILLAQVAGAPAPSFWHGWVRLRAEYEQRIPA